MHQREEDLPEDKAVVRLLIRYSCFECGQFYFIEKAEEKICPKGHEYSGSREVRGDVVPTRKYRKTEESALEG